MSKPPKGYFTRSDGTDIELFDDYFESKSEWPVNLDSFSDFVEESCRKNVYPTTKGFFYNKVFMAQFFLDFINTIPIVPENFNRMLDLATGPAIKSRLLKTLNVVDEAWGIDIDDRSSDYHDAQSKIYLREMVNKLFASNVNEVVQLANQMSQNRAEEMCPNPPLPEFLLELEEQSLDRFTVDEYIVQDFHKLEEELPAFDLITAFSCLSWFDIPNTFKRVYDLLEPGGIFFFDLKNWYFLHGGEMHLPLDAPWLHARLTREDLLRYYQEVRPSYYEDAKEAIFIKTPHMTTEDLIEEANKAGFEVVTARRQMKNNHTGIFYNYRNYLRETVLPQARDINPNVTLKTFLNKYRIMVLRKPS